MGVAGTSMVVVLLSATNVGNVVRSILMAPAFGSEGLPPAMGMCLMKICVGLDRAAKASRLCVGRCLIFARSKAGAHLSLMPLALLATHGELAAKASHPVCGEVSDLRKLHRDGSLCVIVFFS